MASSSTDPILEAEPKAAETISAEENAAADAEAPARKAAEEDKAVAATAKKQAAAEKKAAAAAKKASEDKAEAEIRAAESEKTLAKMDAAIKHFEQLKAQRQAYQPYKSFHCDWCLKAGVVEDGGGRRIRGDTRYWMKKGDVNCCPPCFTGRVPPEEQHEYSRFISDPLFGEFIHWAPGAREHDGEDGSADDGKDGGAKKKRKTSTSTDT